jgi:hypothetical protein
MPTQIIVDFAFGVKATRSNWLGQPLLADEIVREVLLQQNIRGAVRILQAKHRALPG